MKGKFRFLDFFIIAILLLVAVIFLDMFRHDLMFTFNLQNVEPIGTVVIKRNTVQRRLGDRVLWDRLVRESPVYVWDIIRVADVSAATLYIQNNSIELDENTLVRIVPASDDDGFQIVLSYGTLSHYAPEGAGRITLEINGQQIVPQPNTVLRAVASEDGQSAIQAVESIEREISGPLLLSPALNSLIRFQTDLPALNFQWTEVEEAVSYILEISRSADFVSPLVQRQSSLTSITVFAPGEGTWFWRVMPVLPPIFGDKRVFSAIEFFSMEQTIAESNDAVLSFSEWLVMEAPPAELPPEVPAHLIPAHFIQEIISEPEPAPEPAPLPPPPPVILLASPQNLRPLRGANIGFDDLLSQRSIVFSWSPVQGANNYIFSLYRQTAAGRRQIIRTTLNRTSYTLNNLGLLDRGNFVWQVEAVNTGSGGTITRNGSVVENIFSINFPFPGMVYIEDPGILYGN